VCVCVLVVFWIKKKQIAVRVARKANSGMDVHRSIPENVSRRQKINDVGLDRRKYYK
jgi:hypothetical protein